MSLINFGVFPVIISSNTSFAPFSLSFPSRILVTFMLEHLVSSYKFQTLCSLFFFHFFFSTCFKQAFSITCLYGFLSLVCPVSYRSKSSFLMLYFSSPKFSLVLLIVYRSLRKFSICLRMLFFRFLHF